jgi:methionyl-tRNA formyltransferase
MTLHAPPKPSVAFAGTPEFAAIALQALIDADIRVSLVLTQPDKPAGRGMKLTASAVKQTALAAEIAVSQPRSLRLEGKYPEDAAAAHAQLQAANADIMVVAAYGLILPPKLLEIPAHGCLNIHGSLLPRWRGAAPIQRAIEAGDSQTGITLMQMDAGLDTGAMLSWEKINITATDTAATLHDALAVLGAHMLVRDLSGILSGAIKPVPQPPVGISYAEKIKKEEAAIDWGQPAEILARRIRAFDPFPGAWTRLAGEEVKIWQAQAIPASDIPAPAGTVIAVSKTSLVIATGSGMLQIMQVQRPGKKRQNIAEWLSGSRTPVVVGAIAGLHS